MQLCSGKNLNVNAMKKFFRTSLFIVACLGLIPIITSCKKEDKIPIVVTGSITNIRDKTATCEGSVLSDGSGMIIEKGICWVNVRELRNPTIGDRRTIETGSENNFLSNLFALDPFDAYYVRAYAINRAGTGYGLVYSFATIGIPTAATVSAATDVTSTTATLNGTINTSLTIEISFEYGTSSDYGSTITAVRKHVIGNTFMYLSAEITNLTAGTIYHFRIKTVNPVGSSYSDDMTFTTL